ncbi:hypothetical protein [Nonomuraea sp. MG754425]|uniref:hypothetical protein n=1 Tax=Nonomuraea sp. MG754425 TaxID=2570319 RepID=UPI001F1F2E74|nr:hypothetical protein [Nonomuraea sp. MG754425]
MTLAHFLDGLCCADCGAINVLRLDPLHALIECTKCGTSALIVPEIGKEIR